MRKCQKLSKSKGKRKVGKQKQAPEMTSMPKNHPTRRTKDQSNQLTKSAITKQSQKASKVSPKVVFSPDFRAYS